MKGLQRWNFVEVRQLKDSVTVVNDGVFRTERRRVAGVNWAKWLKSGSRNVRVKFVDDSYTLAAANVEPAPAGEWQHVDATLYRRHPRAGRRLPG